MFVITILLFIFNRIVIDPEFVDHVVGVRHLRRVNLHVFFRVFYTRRQIRSAWTQLDCDTVKSIAGQEFSMRKVLRAFFDVYLAIIVIAHVAKVILV